MRKRRRRQKRSRQKNPVSVKKLRNGGRRTPTRIGEATSTPAVTRELAEARNCDALDPITGVVYFRKEYKKQPGKFYNARIVKGVKCEALAIMSFSKDGKTVHRCARHIQQS